MRQQLENVLRSQKRQTAIKSAGWRKSQRLRWRKKERERKSACQRQRVSESEMRASLTELSFRV